MNVVFIVNGEDVEIPLGDTLENMAQAALKVTGNTGHPVAQWEIRNSNGDLMDRAYAPTLSQRLFLSLKVGCSG